MDFVMLVTKWADALKHPAILLQALFSLLGIWILLWSANHWFAMQAGTLGGPSFCSFSSYWNCDRVALTAYASVFGIPVGLFGAAWFFVCLLLSWTEGISRKIVLSAYGLAWLSCLYFAFVLLVQLRMGCLVCLLGYLAWAGAGLSLFFSPRMGLLSRFSSGFCFLVGVLLLSFAGLRMSSSHVGDFSPEELSRLRDNVRQATAERIVIDSPMRYGTTGSDLVVHEFFDYGCPACAAAFLHTLPVLMNEFEMELISIPYPRDGRCNPALPDNVRSHSCSLSEAGLCLREQNRDKDFSHKVMNTLLEENRLISLEEALRGFRHDSAALQSCLDRGEMREKLQEMIVEANRLQIRATPTFFINGRRMQGALPIPLFRVVLEELQLLEK
ncbi:MAG: hypothetical protein EA369_02650 [Bradymonadales bacterium]|nr:MAG: hypothetical protein EA369_02650 [Bradymonadales bacterium]